MSSKMATSVHDTNYQELNVVFKTLGERGKEAEIKKDYNDYVVTYVLQQLSEYLSKKTSNRIVARPYGSAVEDLKSLVADDYGDVDIMIFPTSDDCLVHEELLEYSPENPLHAKIKGRDHAVFQSCLVEDTEYVATSALKNFHSAIYGSAAPGLFDLFKSCMQALSREDLTLCPECVYSWKNKEDSPAFSAELHQSFGTLVEQMQKIKDSQSLQDRDVTQWEWFAKALCDARGTEYTTEHAEVLSDLFQHAGEVQSASANKDGSTSIFESFQALFQEIFGGVKIQNLKARVQEIESRSQNETESGTSEAVENDQHPVTPENRDANESGSSLVAPNNNKEPYVTPQNCENGQGPTEDIKSAASFDSIENSRADPTSEGVDDKIEVRTKADESGTEMRNSIEKEKLTSDNVTHSEDSKEEAHKEARWRTYRWMEHILGTKTEMKEGAVKGKEYERKEGVDLVPALKSQGWPKVARDWIKTDRKWPSPEMVDKVIQEGYHMVVKPPKNGDSECYFRISFSHAEFLLSQEMNEVQRECYRCLKKIHRAHLSKPTGLVTFHLKNILLQTIEETGAEMWTESNRAECMMKLLRNLLEALTKKDLRHFFVRSYNLFGVDYIEDPKVLESLAEAVERIMESPLEISKKLIQRYRDDAKKVEEQQCEETGKARSEGNDESQSKEETSSALLTGTPTQGISASYTYHELEDICLEISKELIDKALNGADCNLETMDPVERSLVEDLRELASIHGLKPEEFLTVIKTCWASTMCYNVWMSTEPDMRRRMLDAIQGHVQMIKWMLKQEDFAAGNEQAIADRMLDPSADDPFDLSHVIPAGGIGRLIGRSLENLGQSLSQPTQLLNMDDIPLD